MGAELNVSDVDVSAGDSEPVIVKGVRSGEVKNGGGVEECVEVGIVNLRVRIDAKPERVSINVRVFRFGPAAVFRCGDGGDRRAAKVGRA